MKKITGERLGINQNPEPEYIECTCCGWHRARVHITPSNEPANFPGAYMTIDCPHCDFYEFSYYPAEA